MIGSEPAAQRAQLELIETLVRSALAAAGTDATAIDLACGDGLFALRLLEWGAQRVVGADPRAASIQRAEQARDGLDIPPARLTFVEADLRDLDVRELGTFDVVLALGVLSGRENPVGAARRARSLTRSICVFETQLTRQERPIVHGNGSPEELFIAEASFGALVEPGGLRLIPNRAALAQIAQVAGFERVEPVQPSPHHPPEYVRGDRALLVAGTQSLAAGR